MKTYQGTITIKEHKNDYGDLRPLTIDCENEKELNRELKRIKDALFSENSLPGYLYHNYRKPKKIYAVTFAINERI